MTYNVTIIFPDGAKLERGFANLPAKGLQIEWDSIIYEVINVRLHLHNWSYEAYLSNV